MRRLHVTACIFRRADNSRVSTPKRMGGWDQVRWRLRGDEDGDPMIFFVDHCRDAIRTLPMQQHDDNRPEDLDTEGEDHAVDDIRYACMSRPFGAASNASKTATRCWSATLSARRTTLTGVQPRKTSRGERLCLTTTAAATVRDSAPGHVRPAGLRHSRSGQPVAGSLRQDDAAAAGSGRDGSGRAGSGPGHAAAGAGHDDAAALPAPPPIRTCR